MALNFRKPRVAGLVPDACQALQPGVVGGSTNGIVGQAVSANLTGIEEVATIEDDRAFQAGLDGGEIDTAELVPLGDDDQAVGAIKGVQGVGRQGQVGAITVEALRLPPWLPGRRRVPWRRLPRGPP
jgi:hypothetical protein